MDDLLLALAAYHVLEMMGTRNDRRCSVSNDCNYPITNTWHSLDCQRREPRQRMLVHIPWSLAQNKMKSGPLVNPNLLLHIA